MNGTSFAGMIPWGWDLFMRRSETVRRTRKVLVGKGLCFSFTFFSGLNHRVRDEMKRNYVRKIPDHILETLGYTKDLTMFGCLIY